MGMPSPPQDSENQEESNPAISNPKPSSSLFRSSLVVGVMTMLSRVLGLARDVVLANFFGASAGADAFFVAFKIPNFFRRLFAEGAFSQAFIPVLADYKTRNELEEVRTLLGSVAGVLGFILLVFTLLAVAGAPWLTALFAPGFVDDPHKYALASEMLRITFPYLMLISLTAFAGAVLNSYGNFSIPAITPVLLNIVLISSALFLAPMFSEPVLGLAWGVLIAGALQLFFQLPFLLRMGLLPRLRFDYRHEGVRRIGRLMLPALFGVSVSQINLLLDTVLASFLQTGSVSWLYYSDRLVELPLGIFGIAIATVILPNLSAKHASASTKAFSSTLDWALRMVVLIGMPAAVALLVLAEPLITTLFHYGALQDRDVVMAAQSLRAYSLGLLAFMFVKVLAPGFFSRQDMKTPVKIGILAMVANMVLNLALIWPLQHAGLALATALSSWLNAACLLWVLRKQKVFEAEPGWFLYLSKIGLAISVMLACLLLLNDDVSAWFAKDVWQRILDMFILVAVGVSSYFITLFAVRINLRRLVRSKHS
jgi:putative peptidoglycan lipid II flippase